jgi:hypothetical protein
LAGGFAFTNAQGHRPSYSIAAGFHKGTTTPLTVIGAKWRTGCLGGG